MPETEKVTALTYTLFAPSRVISAPIAEAVGEMALIKRIGRFVLLRFDKIWQFDFLQTVF